MIIFIFLFANHTVDMNNFQPPLIPNRLPMIQQTQPNSIPSSSIPTLSPATIVRTAFNPPLDHPQFQQQRQRIDSAMDSTYIFPIQEMQRGINPGSMSTSAFQDQVPILNTSIHPQQPQPQQQQQKNKGQSKQPPQTNTTKKAAKKQSTPEFQQTKNSASGQQFTSSGNRLSKKQQEKEDYYNRKYQLLRKCIRSLVFKNAALCDEVARLHQRIATVDDERKLIMKRVLYHERLKVRRQHMAEAKRAQQAAAAAAASITPILTMTPVQLSVQPSIALPVDNTGMIITHSIEER